MQSRILTDLNPLSEYGEEVCGQLCVPSLLRLNQSSESILGRLCLRKAPSCPMCFSLSDIT